MVHLRPIRDVRRSFATRQPSAPLGQRITEVTTHENGRTSHAAISQGFPATGHVSSLDISTATLPARLRVGAATSVLDVTEWFGDTSGGIRTYLLQKALYVAARPWLRHVLLVPGAYDAIAEEDGVRMYRLQGPPIPRQKPYRFMLATRSIGRVVRHESPDIMEVGSPFMVPWIVRNATRDLNIPMVCFYHTNLPRIFAPRDGQDGVLQRARYRAAWQYMRRLDRLFPLTIVSSEYSARELANEGIARVVRVPLGVDLEQFHPRNRAVVADTRARFRLPDTPLAGFVGRFAREKELLMLLDAWPAVERRTGARLVLAGAGPMEAQLRNHPYGARVCFIPFQNDRPSIARLMACFDLYLSPGRIETFGLSSLEAMASGTAVLSANEGGAPELIISSQAGAVFEAGVSSSLTAVAIALFQQNLEAAGQRGRQYAEREHSWTSVFDRLFDVYRTVLTQ